MTREELMHVENLRMLARWCQEQSRTATIYLYAIQAADFIEQSRAEIIEECAKVCEQQAQDFLSPQYATNQPLSSLMERFACKECASAIRSLKKDSHDEQAREHKRNSWTVRRLFHP